MKCRKMAVPPDFVDVFANYLSSELRLPFVSNSYLVIKPEPGGDHVSDWGRKFSFGAKLQDKKKPFGYIDVVPDVTEKPDPFVESNSKSFLIDNISSGPNNNRQSTRKQGFAREFV